MRYTTPHSSSASTHTCTNFVPRWKKTFIRLKKVVKNYLVLVTADLAFSFSEVGHWHRCSNSTLIYQDNGLNVSASSLCRGCSASGVLSENECRQQNNSWRLKRTLTTFVWRRTSKKNVMPWCSFPYFGIFHWILAMLFALNWCTSELWSWQYKQG